MMGESVREQSPSQERAQQIQLRDEPQGTQHRRHAAQGGDVPRQQAREGIHDDGGDEHQGDGLEGDDVGSGLCHREQLLSLLWLKHTTRSFTCKIDYFRVEYRQIL